jgi:hypothetical protein
VITERESAGYLLAETVNLLRLNGGLALAALGVMTVIGMASDLYPAVTGLAGLASIFVNLFLQYQISLALLGHYDLLHGYAGQRRIWALLGLNILSGLGIVLGMILLIIPGVYLMVRWSAAVPALIAEEVNITESLGRSAQAVEGRFWHVLAALLVIWTICILGVAVAVLMPEDQSLIVSLITNLFISVGLVAGWHLAVAIYAGRQDGNRLAEVFA